MKGVIAACFSELVESKFGKEKLEDILRMTGLDPKTKFLVTSDLPDETVEKVIKNSSEVLKLNMKQIADAFGEYWVSTFASKIYKAYFNRAHNSKDFLLAMDNIHKEVTNTIPNSHPPRFVYEWKNEKKLLLTYKSPRNMIVFLEGLVKGVGKYFKENIKVIHLSDQQIQVEFA